MKFRRQKSGPDQEADQTPDPGADTADAKGATPEVPDGRRSNGPWDLTEVTVDEDDPTQVDLGGLLVRGRDGLELRLQVDESSQEVSAVLLVTAQGALELRPFAAPRNGDIWDDIRREIAAETTRRGGTATEEEGEFGPELRVMMPVTTPEGKAATQPSRVLGVRGPRWLLRATFLGRPAVNPATDGDLETALREVVVVRGEAPMAPGDPLPLKVPANAQPVQQRQA
ncbi:MAG TPA: DUF3710 domain-containing protein [Nocardioidaceae bacterium]|nr:DUF3710 domain-containing protein [Nocardioidaceae bacterium]